jgi:hypothetical protein
MNREAHEGHEEAGIGFSVVLFVFFAVPVASTSVDPGCGLRPYPYMDPPSIATPMEWIAGSWLHPYIRPRFWDSAPGP